MLVADTDFLSAAIKADFLQEVLDTFEEEKVILPLQVEEEILSELEVQIDDAVEIKTTEPIEAKELGKGERAAIGLASEDDLLLTNDRKACKIAKRHGVKPVTIPGFLKFGLERNKIEDKEVEKIVEKLRKKDNYRFSKKEREQLEID